MTKISNQYSLTNILTADLTNSRLGINNVSPTVALDVTGAGKFSGALTGTTATFSGELSTTSGLISISGGGGAPPTGGVGFRTVTGRLIVYGGTSDITFQKNSNAGPNLTILESGAATFSGSITSNSGDIFATDGTRTNFFGVGTGASLGYVGTTTNHALAFLTNNTEKMRINTSGNVGIGTSSPQSLSTGTFKFLDISNTGTSATAGLTMHAQTGGQEFSIHHTNGVYIDVVGHSTASNNFMQFRVASANSTYTSYVDAMRITSGGNVLIGGTTTLGASGTNLEISGGRAQLVVNSTTATASWFTVYPAGDGNTYILRNTGYSYLFGTATNQTTAGFVQQMSISSNGSIGAPSGTNIYNASDVRLKKNISTTTYGLNAISALNPVKFNWVDGFEPTEDGKDMLGFIAQEVQAVLPEAVESFGGNSVTIGDTIIDNPLRVNEKFIIPVLVKAIQELSAKVSLLENK